jgi:3-deoxy-7-phosphoheptulonate synthase/chorismate mutase
MPNRELDELRERVDDLNSRLLDLLQERAGVVLEISRVKDELGLQAHDPVREAEMLLRLARSTAGPFGPAEVAEVFRAIFRASLALQERERHRWHAGHPLHAGGDTP